MHLIVTMNTLAIALVCCMVVSTNQQVLPGMNCTSGSFMNTLTKSCQTCTPAPEDYNAVEEYACSSTHDAKYRCKEGFFNLDGAETLVCQKCRECDDPGSFVVKSCSAEQDTECSSQKIGVGEPTTTTARNRINTTISPNTTSTQQDKTATDSPISTSTNSQTRMTFSNKTSGLQNTTSTSDSTRGTDIKTNGTGLLCGRNEYADEKTNSCKPCSYNDLDLNSQQTLVPCTEGKNRTQDNCPKQCFVKEGSFDWFRLFYILGGILLLCLIVCCVCIYRRCKATREAKLTLPLTTEVAERLL